MIKTRTILAKNEVMYLKGGYDIKKHTIQELINSYERNMKYYKQKAKDFLKEDKLFKAEYAIKTALKYQTRIVELSNELEFGTEIQYELKQIYLK